jgi:hypothetical protein
MSRTRHARPARREPPHRGVRAIGLLDQWKRRHGHTTMDVARLLKRSWTYTARLLKGAIRPTVDDMHTMRIVAAVPLDYWFTSEQRAETKAKVAA